MTPAGFLQNKWPQLHAYVVEECRVLHVNDLLRHLSPFHRKLLRTWQPDKTRPRVMLVSQMGGPFIRWWFIPRCRRRCDALYMPPDVKREDWRCRVCWGLVYASQRYGERHPLRKTLTHRKRVTVRKEVVRQQRRQHRLMQKQRRQLDGLPRFHKPQEGPGYEEAVHYVADMIAQGKGLVIRVE